ncbi:MAG: hypothetical protein HOP15_08785 [Planctomycetes bacterium]|nr:hypothetical protein [Planctomycetota bacterium]
MPLWFVPVRVALGALALASCAALDSDLHLAPLYTRVATADGGTLLEIAGGLYRQHRRDEGDFLEWRTLAPLYGIERQRDGSFEAEHPFPLGRTRVQVDGTGFSYLVPLYASWFRPEPDGTSRRLLLTLPGFLLQKTGDGTHGGWFPFYGRLVDLLTFDDLRFALWPFYVRADRAGRVSHHFLWPFFGWTSGGGESSWHLFPLFGRARWEGRYDRTYVLWPFFHWQRNNLGGGGEEPEKAWMLFPFFGKKERGTYAAWTGLWPFFGFARDPRSGFWALDFPFFLVRIQRGPEATTARTRFWPFYSHLRTEQLETHSYLWPLLHLRHEDDALIERDSATLVPFWQSSDARSKASGETSSWRKLWPLLRSERQDDWRAGALLELDPFWRNDLVPRHATGFFRIWEWEQEPAFRRERAFLGLYRRERGRGEDRRSLSGLWGRRSYADGGKSVRETSLLFGLVRWRVTAEHGFDMLRPAFPGPGWPRPAQAASAAASRTYF